MGFQEDLNAAFRAVDESTLRDKTVPELIEMLKVLRRFHASQYHSPPAHSAIMAIENELTRRTNEDLAAKNVQLHNELMQEHRSLKASVDSLKEPHWTLTPAFWIAVAILAVAILAWIFPRDHAKETMPSVPVKIGTNATVSQTKAIRPPF